MKLHATAYLGTYIQHVLDIPSGQEGRAEMIDVARDKAPKACDLFSSWSPKADVRGNATTHVEESKTARASVTSQPRTSGGHAGTERTPLGKRQSSPILIPFPVLADTTGGSG